VEEAVQVLVPGDCEEDSAYAGAGLVVLCCFFALGFCAAACPLGLYVYTEETGAGDGLSGQGGIGLKNGVFFCYLYNYYPGT
jgi:hypothetical protein